LASNTKARIAGFFEGELLCRSLPKALLARIGHSSKIRRATDLANCAIDVGKYKSHFPPLQAFLYLSARDAHAVVHVVQQPAASHMASMRIIATVRVSSLPARA
jgi:hypothetical protein